MFTSAPLGNWVIAAAEIGKQGTDCRLNRGDFKIQN